MQLDHALTQIEIAELVRRLNEPDLTYLFQHTLVQETARGSLLRQDRRRVSHLIGEALEDLYADDLDEVAPLLAHFYSEAGDDAKTVAYSLRAGQAAAGKYAHTEALEFFTLGLKAAQHLIAINPAARHDSHLQSLILNLYLARGRTFELSARHPDALSNYEEMRHYAETGGDRAMELAAVMAQATIQSIPGPAYDPLTAPELNAHALSLARELGDKAAEARTLWALGLMNSRANNHYRAARAYFEQALEIARAQNLRERLAYILNDLSPLLAFLGEPEQAEQYNLEARALWREFNNLPMLTDNLNYAVMNHLSSGQFERAIDESQQSLKLSREIGNAWGEAFGQTWIGEAYVERGEIGEALRVMETAIALGAQTFPPTLVLTRSHMARLYGDLGRVETGIELAQQAVAKGKERFVAMVPEALGALAHLYVLNGDLAQAQVLVSDALAQLANSDSRFEIRRAISQVELLLAQGHYDEAVLAAEKLLNHLRTYRFRQNESLTQLLYARALGALGKWDQAAEQLELARTRAEAMGARFSLWQILAASSDLERWRGHTARAQSLRAQARAQVEYIAERTPDDLRVTFLNSPPVRALMIHDEH